MVFRNTAEGRHCAEHSHGSSDSVFITTLSLFHLYVFLKNNNSFLAAQGLGCYVQASLVAVSKIYSWCSGFSLWSMGSSHVGLVAVLHGLSCPMACGIFLDQESNLCPLHWQVILYHWTTEEVLSFICLCLLDCETSPTFTQV